MAQFAYLGMLAFVILVTLPLELYLGVRVWRRPLRLALTVLPVAAVFLLWDAYAIGEGHWTFDDAQVSGITLPAGIPLEELLFFIVVPIAAIMTLEAVRLVNLAPIGDGLTPARTLSTDRDGQS